MKTQGPSTSIKSTCANGRAVRRRAALLVWGRAGQSKTTFFTGGRGGQQSDLRLKNAKCIQMFGANQILCVPVHLHSGICSVQLHPDLGPTRGIDSKDVSSLTRGRIDQ